MQMRVVVTGMGVVSPLASGVDATWSRIIKGRSGLRRLPEDLVADIPAKVGGVVPSRTEDSDGFDPDRLVLPKDQRRMDRFILLAIEAADQALAQADWHPEEPLMQERTATIVASGIGGFGSIGEAMHTVATRGPRRLSPFTVPSFLVNLAAGNISIRYGLKGPIGAPVTACAASVQAIGDGLRMIRAGEADVALCGGAEACIHPVALGGFAAARSLSTGFNDRPEQASRPFDQSRDGFVMGEGAGMLLLERLDHALDRGAQPLAEIIGYGTSADAHHVTAGSPDGNGAYRAMRTALAMADLAPNEVGYINAHATATQVGDAAELAAIRRLFADKSPAISSTKSATGHLLGAAGGLEAVISVSALRSGVLPPTLNLTLPDQEAADLDLLGPQTRRADVDCVLSNGFGFGGVNATVIFRRWSGS